MQYYNIAGLTVGMNSFGRTASQALPYQIARTDTDPDIIIQCDWRTVKQVHPGLSEDECEYLASGANFYRQLLGFGGMMLHASAVVLNGKAYLFSAPCGTGKSTHTSLWCRVFADQGARILNDDKPALRLEDGKFYAYGTPWSGKTDQNINVRVPLGGVCMLARGEQNVIRPYGGTRAIRELLEQTVKPKDANLMSNLLGLLDQLLRNVPVWKMECNMDPEAARVAYAAMSDGGKES